MWSLVAGVGVEGKGRLPTRWGYHENLRAGTWELLGEIVDL